MEDGGNNTAMERETEIVLERLLTRYGTTVSKELGIVLEDGTPSALFRLLCAALLMSAPIRHEAAISAARALAAEGWTTAGRMDASTAEARARVLNDAGYARLDESAARMLGEAARHLLDAHDGDLRALRAAAGRDPDHERARLKAFKGIGDVGADIFFREVQTVWPEHFPFLDDRARSAARRLGVPDTPDALADWAGRAAFPALVSALVRADLAGATRAGLLADGAERAS